MPELIIGTTNPAKVEQIRGALRPLGITVSGLDKNINLPKIKEDGATAEVNACEKALAYARALGQPVLSMDNALYLDGLSPEKQPGVHVRRINKDNVRASDKEVLAYYSSLIDSFGGRINGEWHFALCFATPEGETQETTIISPRIFVSQPSSNIIPGYPLESIQIDPNSGRYVSDLSLEDQDIYWQKAIGEPLMAFVKTLKIN